MLIAKEKRKSNIAEYLLYMFQVEDLIRACDFNEKTIKEQLVDQYEVNDSQKEEILGWYTDLAKQMKEEKIQKSGHLQSVINTILELTSFHEKLLKKSGEERYNELYHQAFPYINQLQSRSLGKDQTVLEICLNAMYGVLILRLQKKEISKETDEAISTFSAFLSYLADRFRQYEEGKYEI